MLSIRLQRTGRKGYATYRVVVQDSRRSPSSGRVVSVLGNYNPHTKKVVLEDDRAKFYLKNGARPTSKVVSLLKDQKISVPKWAEKPAKKKRAVKNPEKLRKNRPADAKADKPAEKPAAEEPVKAEESKPEETDKAEDKNQDASENQQDSKAEKDSSAEAESEKKSNEDSANKKQEEQKDNK